MCQCKFDKETFLAFPLQTSLFVMVWTANGADGFDGAGAFVCPANAGFAQPAWPWIVAGITTTTSATAAARNRSVIRSSLNPNL